jgi:hypothetical protein
MSFDEWKEKLNTIADRFGYKTGGESLTDHTGEDCWREFYEHGYTPYEALQEDASRAI